MRPLQKLNQSDFKMEIIEDLGTIYLHKNSKRKKRYAIFKCNNCLENFKTRTDRAKKEKSEVCISCSVSINIATHNKRGSVLYSRWSNIKARCLNKNNKTYENYGRRGISICDEWKNDFMSFYKWAINNGYSEDLTIDRIDNDGNYEPSNCRWADLNTQMQNTRLLKSTNKSGYRGVSWVKASKKWASVITHNRKRVSFGLFTDKVEAAKVRDQYILDNNLNHPLNFKPFI